MKMHNIPRYSYIVIGDFNWYLINRRGYSCANLLALRIDDNKFEITVVYSNQFYSLNETKNSVRRAAISPEIPLQEVDVKSFYLLAYLLSRKERFSVMIISTKQMSFPFLLTFSNIYVAFFYIFIYLLFTFFL